MRLILRLTIAFISSNAIRAAIGFATAVLMARELGAADFGRWTLCMTIASTLTAVLDLGFGVLLTRDAARAPARRGNTEAAAIAEQSLGQPGSAVSARSAFPRDDRTIGAEVSNALLARLGLLAPVAVIV